MSAVATILNSLTVILEGQAEGKQRQNCSDIQVFVDRSFALDLFKKYI